MEGDQACTACHNEGWRKPILGLYHTRHGVKGDARTPGCQTCHGPSARHRESPGETPPDVVFASDTAFPGQAGTVVIMGRQAIYGGPFRRIASLEVGDEIAFATGQGNSLYTVTGIRHAGDPAPVPDATAARLTLMTGDGTPYLPSDVVRVDAVLKSGKFPSATGPLTAGSLARSEQAMSGDRSALLPLVR